MPSEATARVGTPRLRVVGPDEISPGAARAHAERSVRRLLVTLTVSVAGLTVLGLVMVLSASSISAFTQYGSSFTFFKRQLVYAVLGGMAATITARVSHRAWQKVWAPLLVLSVALLILVLHPAYGIIAGGSARWISLGWFYVQPSELAKFALVATAAAILTRHFKHLDDAGRWLVSMVPIVGGVALLVMLQPDLGTTMVLVGTMFIVTYVAGVRLRVLAVSVVVAGGAGFLMILGEGYRRTRLLSFLDPWADPQNTGYQIIQSLIALGSGRLVGVGLGASRQKWQYVPNAHTDFIFSIMGEELGLLGELLVLAMFGAILFAGVRIAIGSPDVYGRLLAAGITGWIGLQALVNLGAVTGVLPITGVPLPFMSFGGSSLIVSLASVGVLFSIGRASMERARSPSRRRRPDGANRGRGGRAGSPIPRPSPAGARG
jgi:cell division protein FtsW